MMFHLVDALTPRPLPDVEAPPESYDEAEAAARLAAEWNSSLKPFDAFEVRLVDDIALQTVRIDHCRRQQRDLRAQRANRASKRWDEDRRDEAEALGAALAKSPALVARQLRRTKQGCDWLIDRWGRLLLILDAMGTWNPSQLKLAHRPPGRPRRVPRGPHGPARRSGGPRRIRPSRGRDPRTREGRSARRDRAQQRARAERGDGPDEGGELAALLRREQMFACRFEWSKDQLKKGRHAHPTLNGPGGGRSPIASPATPPPRPQKTEEEWRQVTQARAAIKAAKEAPNPPNESVTAPLPSLVSSQPQAPVDEPPGPPPEESPEAIVARCRPRSVARRFATTRSSGPSRLRAESTPCSPATPPAASRIARSVAP